MSVPLTPPLSFFPPPPQYAPVSFPIGWLLENAATPIKYRSLVEVARLDARAYPRLPALTLGFAPALALAMQQSLDGTWSQAMTTLPSARGTGFEGIGTIPAVRRLLEYGWDRESPPLIHARRVLFRLLAEDNDPSLLYECAPRVKDEDLVRRARALLREQAAAALAQAGYEGDPRLRGAARRILERVAGFIRSPIGPKPWIRVGNKQVLAAEAAPPSFYTLQMLAYMPLFRSEHHDQMEAIFQHVSQPMPRQESQQVVGKKIIAQPHYILGDMLPHRNAVDADVPYALTWLELMARLGFLRKHEAWSKLLDRFIDDRDSDGVWHPHKGMAAPKTTNPVVWPSFPLEPPAGAGDERWTDVTFRLGLIARCAGRQIDLV